MYKRQPDDEVAIKPFEIFQKEIEIKASFINPYTQQRALDLIKMCIRDSLNTIATIKYFDF